MAFGEILWDIIDGQPHLGGAPLNFAAHLAKSGVQSEMISAVGTDYYGAEAKKRVKELSVGVDLVSELSEYPTGTVDVFLEDGQPDYLIHTNVAFDHIRVKKTDLEHYDLFYFGTLIQRETESRESLYRVLQHNNFDYIFYDVNLRKNCFNSETLKTSLGYANIIKLNMDEVHEIARLIWNQEMSLEGFLVRLNKEFSPRIVIITDGGNGCYVFESNELKHVAGVKVKVKDAVGAGDSFSAAFMAKYMKSKDALLSAMVANKVGAYVASCEGAIPDYSKELIEELR